MAQHATSHFISKIIITDSAYQDGMDPEHEWQSVGTFYSGIYLCFRFIFPSALQMWRLHDLICLVGHRVCLCSVMRVRKPRCHNNTALSSISLAVCTTSLVSRTIVWLIANELWVIHATESGTLPGTSRLPGLLCFLAKPNILYECGPLHMCATLSTAGRQIKEDFYLYSFVK